MTDASKWRFQLARRIAASYAQNPKVRVIMVAGSVGRGMADRYSDLEIDVYYDAPPTENERISAASECGGDHIELDQNEIEWEEQFYINGFHAATSTFLTSTMAQFLTLTVDHCQIDENAQMRLHSLLHSKTLTGDQWVEPWRKKAKQYPDGLMHTILQQNLRFRSFWYTGEMFAARNDALALYDTFVNTGQQLLCALMGLNRIYISTPNGLKWMDESIQAMEIKPANLSARIKRAFQQDLTDGMHELKTLILEVLDLVDKHAPSFDTTPFRGQHYQRHAWDAPPEGISKN